MESRARVGRGKLESCCHTHRHRLSFVSHVGSRKRRNSERMRLRNPEIATTPASPSGMCHPCSTPGRDTTCGCRRGRERRGMAYGAGLKGEAGQRIHVRSRKSVGREGHTLTATSASSSDEAHFTTGKEPFRPGRSTWTHRARKTTAGSCSLMGTMPHPRSASYETEAITTAQPGEMMCALITSCLSSSYKLERLSSSFQ